MIILVEKAHMTIYLNIRSDVTMMTSSSKNFCVIYEDENTLNMTNIETKPCILPEL